MTRWPAPLVRDRLHEQGQLRRGPSGPDRTSLEVVAYGAPTPWLSAPPLVASRAFDRSLVEAMAARWSVRIILPSFRKPTPIWLEGQAGDLLACFGGTRPGWPFTGSSSIPVQVGGKSRLDRSVHIQTCFRSPDWVSS